MSTKPNQAIKTAKAAYKTQVNIHCMQRGQHGNYVSRIKPRATHTEIEKEARRVALRMGFTNGAQIKVTSFHGAEWAAPDFWVTL